MICVSERFVERVALLPTHSVLAMEETEIKIILDFRRAAFGVFAIALGAGVAYVCIAGKKKLCCTMIMASVPPLTRS